MKTSLLALLLGFGMSLQAAAVATCDQMIENSFVNICSRGKVGDAIAKATGAESCRSVSIDAMANLESLDLSGLGIRQLMESDLEGFYSLKNLDLSRNRLTRIPHLGIFVVGQVEFLHLQGNRIQRLSIQDFEGFLSLQFLNLEENGIREVESEVFYRHGQLEKVWMFGNNVGELDGWDLGIYPVNTQVYWEKTK